jgi:hypothetical protein
MIKSFDKSNLGTIRKDLEQALAGVAKEHGLTISVGNIRFNTTEFGTKLQVRVANGSAGVTEVSRYSPLSALGLGFKDEDMGKVVSIGGKKYEVVGCKPRAWKMPMIVKDVRTGKLFKMSASAVGQGLGMTKKEIDFLREVANQERGDGRYDD